jgi:hypothetical protein
MHLHVLGEVCVDEDRIELEPVAVGRVHELEMKAVGVGRPVDRHVFAKPRLERHVGDAEALDARAHDVTVALELHAGLFLGLAEKLASEKYRDVGRHRHRETKVGLDVFVTGAHAEHPAVERAHAVGASERADPDRDQWLGRGLERRRQDFAHDLGSGEILHGEPSRVGEDRRMQRRLDFLYLFGIPGPAPGQHLRFLPGLAFN